EAVAARLTEAAARWAPLGAGERALHLRGLVQFGRFNNELRLQAESDSFKAQPLRGECAIVSRDSAASSCAVSTIQTASCCSQVNCLADACGMLGFSNLQQPNQFYRLATSQFLHAGLATLLVTSAAPRLLSEALGTPGWLEADSLSVGSLAAVLVEYITAWPYVESRRWRLRCGCLLCSAGLLPHLRLLYCCGDASFEDEVDGDNIDEEEEAASAAVVEDNADDFDVQFLVL
uniref:DUF4149 domain-containing protein n=1 Tax=Macrostomum lignano TaxID=282301 RepID=A0A1I8F8H6_9PLAT